MRTKEVFKTDEVYHVWAKQSQQNGRNSANNVYFNGTKIYSYGSHFCMAKIIDSGTVLITDRGYSNTTAKHLHGVRYATNHFEQIYIPFPEDNIESNGKALINNIKKELATIGNCRKKEATKEQAQTNLLHLVTNVNRYLDVTNQTLSKRWIDKDLQKEFKVYFNAAKDSKGSEQLAEKLENLRKAKRKEETKIEKERHKLALESIPLWIEGSNNWSVQHRINSLDKVYLRRAKVIQDYEEIDVMIETSKGAKVSLKSAKVLFDLIQQGKDVKGFDIDGYTVISLNGVLTIGCHKIERDEIERFARSQNWIA